MPVTLALSLCALALAPAPAPADEADAAPSPVHGEPPAVRGAPPEDESGPRSREPSGEAAQRPPPGELALRSAAAARGDAAVEALLRWRPGSWALLAGAGSAVGPQAAERRALLLGAEVEGEPLGAALLARWSPAQAGAALVALHAELRAAAEPWAVALSADGSRLSLEAATGPPRAAALELWSGSIGLDLERSVGPWTATARAVAGAASLSATTPRAAAAWLWQQPGLRALQWPLRAALALGARREAGAWTLGLTAGAALPAGPGASLEAGLAAERRLPGCAIAAELGAGRLWPGGLWTGRAALELRIPFGPAG